MLSLPRPVHDQMVAHCLTGLPDEACGLLGGDLATGHAVTCYPTRNLAASASRSALRCSFGSTVYSLADAARLRVG